MDHDTDLRIAIERLYYWQETGSNSFTANLYSLMGRADQTNFAKLQEAFPIEAEAYNLWYLSPDPERFFLKHGLPRRVAAV